MFVPSLVFSVPLSYNNASLAPSPISSASPLLHSSTLFYTLRLLFYPLLPSSTRYDPLRPNRESITAKFKGTLHDPTRRVLDKAREETDMVRLEGEDAAAAPDGRETLDVKVWGTGKIESKNRGGGDARERGGERRHTYSDTNEQCPCAVLHVVLQYCVCCFCCLLLFPPLLTLLPTSFLPFLSCSSFHLPVSFLSSQARPTVSSPR